MFSGGWNSLGIQRVMKPMTQLLWLLEDQSCYNRTFSTEPQGSCRLKFFKEKSLYLIQRGASQRQGKNRDKKAPLISSPGILF